jgi:carbamoyltransferase
MQKTLNMKIKYRESFRPFAPIVLEDRMSEYFAMTTASPYMLLVAPVADAIKIEAPEDDDPNLINRLKYKRSVIPAITHVDYSARIQSVSKDRYPLLYDIIKAFEMKTGCAVLVNTSFNVRGEPIVCTPPDTYRCFCALRWIF